MARRCWKDCIFLPFIASIHCLQDFLGFYLTVDAYNLQSTDTSLFSDMIYMYFIAVEELEMIEI